MDAYERLYEAGELYARVRPEKRQAALRSLESVQAGLIDVEDRVEKLLAWLEKHQGDGEHGGLTQPGHSPPAGARDARRD